MTEARVHQNQADVQEVINCDYVSDLSGPCVMAAGHGPYAESYKKYLERGWRGVLPVKGHTKCDDLPYGYTGHKFANCYPEPGIMHNWSHTSDQNIVLRMPQNVIGIDADQYSKKGAQKRGVDNLRKLEEQLGKLPASYRSTRRGSDNPSGIRFFRVPDSEAGWPGKVCDDVETVHHGHRFAVVWPSQVPHEDTGELLTYQWFTPEGNPMPGPPAINDLPLLPKAWVDFLQKEHRANGGVITSREDFPDHVDIPDEVPHDGPWYMKAMARSNATGRGNDNLAAVVGGIVKIVMQAGQPFAVAQALALNYERASDNPQDDETVVSMVERFWAQDQARRRSEGLPEISLPTTGSTTSDSLVPLRKGKDGHTVVSELLTKETGWLGVLDDQFAMTKKFKFEDKNGQEQIEVKAIPVADFHLEPTRRIKSLDGIGWRVKVINESGEVVNERQITDKELTSDRDLVAWAGKDGGVFYPKNQTYELYITGSNLMRYLKSFELPELEEIPFVGWHPSYGCYVTPDGVIFPGDSKMQGFTDVIPSETAIENCMLRYGFEVGIPEAREIAKKIFYAHDETVMAMLFCFVALVALKGQFDVGTLFPALNIEAFSGSAKTSVITRMIQLIGVTTGGRWTVPAMENTYATAYNGVVFVDDTEMSTEMQDLIRGAITGSAKNKMRAGNGAKRGGGKALAATVISSEGMTDRFNAQKANRDRFVTIKFPVAPDRRFKKNPELSYYEGVILPLENRFGRDFTKIAGSFVSGLSEFVNLMGPVRGTSRAEQKEGYFRAVAPVVAAYLGMPKIPSLVERFFSEQEDLGNASTVALEVLPRVFRYLGRPTRANNHELAMAMFSTPEGQIRVNVGMVADIWEKIGSRSHRDQVLADRTGIETELDALGATKSSPLKVRGLNETNDKGETVTERSIRYRTLPVDVSQKILDLAHD